MNPNLAKLDELVTKLAAEKISTDEAVILVALSKAEDSWQSYVAQRELVRHFEKSAFTVSRVIANLLQRDLVEVAKAKRERQLSLSDKGRAVVDNLTNILAS